MVPINYKSSLKEGFLRGNLVPIDGDCSSTVECTTVARETRVRLPPFALKQRGGRYSLQNANSEVPENRKFSEPPFALKQRGGRYSLQNANSEVPENKKFSEPPFALKQRGGRYSPQKRKIK